MYVQLPHPGLRRFGSRQWKICSAQKVPLSAISNNTDPYDFCTNNGHDLIFPRFFSALGCPLAKKRKLQEVEETQPASKKKPNPLKLAMDDGFNADSDTNSETEPKEEAMDSDDEPTGTEEGTQKKDETPESLAGAQKMLYFGVAI